MSLATLWQRKHRTRFAVANTPMREGASIQTSQGAELEQIGAMLGITRDAIEPAQSDTRYKLHLMTCIDDKIDQLRDQWDVLPRALRSGVIDLLAKTLGTARIKEEEVEPSHWVSPENDWALLTRITLIVNEWFLA